jgi:hypothetical protein
LSVVAYAVILFVVHVLGLQAARLIPRPTHGHVVEFFREFVLVKILEPVTAAWAFAFSGRAGSEIIAFWGGFFSFGLRAAAALAFAFEVFKPVKISSGKIATGHGVA